MKRLVVAILLLSLLTLPMLACTPKTPVSTETKPSETQTETTPTTEEIPFTEKDIAEIKAMYTNSMLQGFGEVINLETNWAAPTYYPINSHPRVLVNSKTLPTVIERLHDPDNKDRLATYEALKNKEISLNNSLVVNNETIEAKAFSYLTEKNLRNGYEAVYLMLNKLSNYKKETYGDSYSSIGWVIFTAAEVYDWCYDLMTNEERSAFIAKCEWASEEMEIGFPPSEQSCICSHGSEEQLLKDWLILSIAVYDEYPSLYEYCAGRFYAEYVPARNYFYATGLVSQGSAYLFTRFVPDLWSALIMENGTGVFPYDSKDNMASIVRSVTYMIRPDTEMIRQGDDFNQKHAPYEIDDYCYAAWFSANLFNDGIAKNMVKFLTKDYTLDWVGDKYSSVQQLIINDPNVEYKSIDLPLTIYHGFPFGRLIARTGWDIAEFGYSGPITSDNIVIMMKMSEKYCGNHDYVDAGSFSIYYKGALAIDGGAYHGSDYDGGTRINYTRTASAHNCLLIRGPENPTGNQVEQPNNEAFMKTLDQWLTYKKATMASVIAESTKETDNTVDYAYLSGDLTYSYGSKCTSSAIRSMLFMQTDESDNMAGVFFVFDRVVTKPGYKAYFTLHMEEEPTTYDNVTIITATKDGADGKLVCQTLSPSDITIEKIGGPGKECFVDGVNYGIDLTTLVEGSDLEYGWGRVEISSNSSNKVTYLLNAMYVTEASNNNPIVEAELIETSTHFAAKLENNIAIFAKAEEVSEDTVEINITGEGTIRYAVTGLYDGTWAVYVDDALISNMTVNEYEYIAYFTAPAGQLKLVKID